MSFGCVLERVAFWLRFGLRFEVLRLRFAFLRFGSAAKVCVSWLLNIRVSRSLFSWRHLAFPKTTYYGFFRYCFSNTAFFSLLVFLLAVLVFPAAQNAWLRFALVVPRVLSLYVSLIIIFRLAFLVLVPLVCLRASLVPR